MAKKTPVPEKTSSESNQLVTVRELRNQGGIVLDRVAGGEPLTITRDGLPVAQLIPIAVPTSLATLKKLSTKLKPIDLDSLREDLDAIFDPWL